MKFTIQEFNRKYPNDGACLLEIFQHRYGRIVTCNSCKRPTTHYRIKHRKCFACQWCGNQLHPLANTIFHKSETSLKVWFYAIFLFANSKNGVSAKELQRQLGVTYKTAWRMAKQIRRLMVQDTTKLHGHLEADETYVGGERPGKRGRGAEGKTPVFGVVQRQGSIRAKVVDDVRITTLLPLLKSLARKGATISTDDSTSYLRLKKLGFKHGTVKHGEGKYVQGAIHTNTIDSFWSQLKRSLNGTYHSVSPKYLQSYVDEFAYRYGRRDELSLFPSLLARVVLPI